MNVSPRKTGRIDVAWAGVLSLLICAVFVYLFVRSDSETDPDASSPGAEETSVESTGDRDDVVLDPDGSDDPPETLREEPPGPGIAGDDKSLTVEDPSSMRVHGRVTDSNGGPLARVSVRWILSQEEDLRRYRHDRSVLGKKIDTKELSDEELRGTLERSRVTESDDDGEFDLVVPLVHAPSVAAASLPGYELVIRPVTGQNGAAPAADAVAPALSGEVSSDPAIERAAAVRVDFTLGFAGTISGTVKDRESGEAAVGMTVLAGIFDPDSPAAMSFVEMDSASVQVREDGAYAIAGLVAGEYRVVARTAESDYVSIPSRRGEKVVLEAGTDIVDVDLLVTRGGVIHGHVTAPDGTLLEGVECQVLPADFMAKALRGDIEILAGDREVQTDEKGYFEFRGLALGESYVVGGEVKGFAVTRSSKVDLTVERPESVVDFSMDEGRSISGRVVLENGVPAPDVPVMVVPEFDKLMAGGWNGAATTNKRTSSQEDGSFVLKDLPRGEFRLRTGELDPLRMFRGETDDTTLVKIDGADVVGVELVHKPDPAGAGRLSGVVVDDTGTPLEGASVKISKASDFLGTSARTVTTGADGEFAAGKLSGAVLKLEASRSGFANATLRDIAADSEDLRITLNRHGHVSGRVVTSGGDLVDAGGTVLPKPAGGDSLAERLLALRAMDFRKDKDLKIAGDGTFSVPVPSGRVEVHVSVPGFAPARSKPIDVAPGADYEGLEIVVTKGAVIYGKVVLEGNRKLEGATVAVSLVDGEDDDILQRMMPQYFSKGRSSGVTDREGEYEIAHLEPGRYSVHAAYPDYAPSDDAKVTLDVDEVREMPALVLTMGGSLSVRVLEVEAPKPGVMVQIMSTGDLKQGMTDKAGVFVQKGLKPGDYQVNAMDMTDVAKGKMRYKPLAVVIADGPNEVEVVFGVGHKIWGKVEGLPPAIQRMVVLRRPGGPAPEDVRPTDVKASLEAQKYQIGVGFITADDRYEIEDLDPGEYILEIPKMPQDPTDLAAYETMDRTPHFSKKVEVKDKDVELDIKIRE